MNYTNLGRTGLKVSRICLGTMTYGSREWRDWVLPEEESRPFIQRALELGINFFDTANVYSRGASEEVVGRALRDFTRRDEVVVATKVYGAMGEKPNQSGLSRKNIMQAIDDSLRRLGMDYVDLYQIHSWDDETPIEETLEAMTDLVRAGKVRYIGASNTPAWNFAKALFLSDHHGWARFISNQNHYNLITREDERELRPLCVDQGVGLIPWSPLARGFLAGNRTRDKGGATTRSKSDAYAHDLYYRESDFAVVDRTVAVAERLGVSPAQVALAWLLRQPGVTAPIVGASRMEQLDQAVAALDITLSDDDCAELEELYEPRPPRR